MAKNKVSEWSATASNNTDIGGINIAEGCAPSGINNAIRELMAQVKDMQSGTDADNFTVGGNLTVTGTATGATPSVSDDSTKFATTAFVRDIIPTGVIVMWSGTIATIPTGWFLCDGSNSTPDLRNRFIIAANADDGGAAKTNVTGSATKTGGSKDAIVVSHTHTESAVADHTHSAQAGFNNGGDGYGDGANNTPNSYTFVTQDFSGSTGAAGGHSHTIDSTGSSGTNANLVPYYALAFIMKS